MYVKMSADKSLIVTVPTTLYQGERNADLITFLVPAEYESKNIADCEMQMLYVTPDGETHAEALRYQPEMYKDYLQYSTVVGTGLTAQEGEVVVWLTAQDEDDFLVVKTGEVIAYIRPCRDMSDISEDVGRIDRLEMQVEALSRQKADNIVFHEEDGTIQLVADGVEIGDRIAVAGGVTVTDVLLNDEQELVIRFSDGTEKVLGKSVLGGGNIYVPHVDERKILTFTIESMAGEIPDPVDLNPNDEWNAIDETEQESDYIWEEM